jgi:hypothetical protein
VNSCVREKCVIKVGSDQKNFTDHPTSYHSLNAIESHLKNFPFGVMPLLRSVSELTVLYSKVIRVYIDFGYIVYKRSFL